MIYVLMALVVLYFSYGGYLFYLVMKNILTPFSFNWFGMFFVYPYFLAIGIYGWLTGR